MYTHLRDDPFLGSWLAFFGAENPPIELKEHDDRVDLSFVVPGYSKDMLTLTAENAALLVSGKGPRGDFRRRVGLPRGAVAQAATAQLLDGVLTVRVPLEARKEIPIAVQGV